MEVNEKTLDPNVCGVKNERFMPNPTNQQLDYVMQGKGRSVPILCPGLKPLRLSTIDQSNPPVAYVQCMVRLGCVFWQVLA